jgi:undecaprenyl diphosphate synthase
MLIKPISKAMSTHFIKQSSLHAAIIMDGNGRWAEARGLPRTAGHAAGAQAVRRTVETAAQSEIHTLTLYAFSADNWRRPAVEVNALMALLIRYLRSEAENCRSHNIRLTVIGRRDRLPAPVVQAIEQAEAETHAGQALELRLAIDYSARDAITTAARAGLLGASPDVDLLIRTGGEQRLSDFLLWESAYAELYFTPVLWPDFSPEHLHAALRWFHARERRYGAVPPAAPSKAVERWLR